MGDRSHGGRLGNWVTINGVSDWRREVRRHERLRLRLANAANARILVLELHGLEGWVRRSGRAAPGCSRTCRASSAGAWAARGSDRRRDRRGGIGRIPRLARTRRRLCDRDLPRGRHNAAPKARRAAGTGTQSGFAAARAGRRTARPAADAGWWGWLLASAMVKRAHGGSPGSGRAMSHCVETQTGGRYGEQQGSAAARVARAGAQHSAQHVAGAAGSGLRPHGRVALGGRPAGRALFPLSQAEAR